MSTMARQLCALAVFEVIVAWLGYLAFRGRSPRVAVAAQIALVVVVLLAVAAIWGVYQFQRNFTIPPM